MNDDIKKQLLYDARKKSVLVAYLIYFIIGGLIGFHRFYIGDFSIGILLLATFLIGLAFPFLWIVNVIFMIWDFFVIPSRVRKRNMDIIDSL